MIVASRRIPSSTRNKLHPKLQLSRLVITTPNSIMASAQSSSSLSTETPPPPPPRSAGAGEWASDLFTGESRSRAISLLTTDREVSGFNFEKFGKSCKKAAVLVPFCYDMEGRPGILYNLRSESLNTHKGEISFPGGTFEPQDNDDPVAAALRETHEELGLSKDQWDLWTTCRVFPTISSKMGVVPVVGFLKTGPVDPSQLEINPDEVDHAFVISLDHLCHPPNWVDMQPPGLPSTTPFRIPSYQNLHEVTEKLQDIHLWGLTAFVTHLVLTREPFHLVIEFRQMKHRFILNRGRRLRIRCQFSAKVTNGHKGGYSSVTLILQPSK